MSDLNTGAIVARQQLNAIFGAEARMKESIVGFLQEMIDDNPETFWGLFDGCSDAAEMEMIVHQTIRGMLKTGLPHNNLALRPDHGAGLVNNSSALRNLEGGGYALVSTDRSKITLSDKMMGKLFAYSSKSAGSTLLLHGPAFERPDLVRKSDDSRLLP